MLDKKVLYFIKTIECGSFSSAARSLYLSQPALSKQITLLEKELGVKLLNRSGYRPVLAQEGEEYYTAVCALKNEYDRLVKGLSSRQLRTIKIGFTGAFENREIIKSIGTIKKRYNSLDVSFVKYSFDESVRALLNGEIDLSLGIESTFKYHSDIEYRVLYQYKICVVCSFDHPLAAKPWVCPRDIMDQDMVLLSPNFGRDFYRDFMEACRLDGFKPRVKKMVDTLDELIFEVSIGAGIAIVSQDVVRDTEVKVLDLKDSHHVSRYVLAYPKGHPDQFVRQFAKEVEENF